MASQSGSLINKYQRESVVDSLNIFNLNFNKVRYHNTVVDSIDTSVLKDEFPSMGAQETGGWQNPYICT